MRQNYFYFFSLKNPSFFMCMCYVEHANPKNLVSERQQFLKPSKHLLLSLVGCSWELRAV